MVGWGNCIVVLAPARKFPAPAVVELFNVKMLRLPIRVITIRGTYLWHEFSFRQSNSNAYWIFLSGLLCMGKYFATWKANIWICLYHSVCTFPRMQLMCHLRSESVANLCKLTRLSALALRSMRYSSKNWLHH